MRHDELYDSNDDFIDQDFLQIDKEAQDIPTLQQAKAAAWNRRQEEADMQLEDWEDSEVDSMEDLLTENLREDLIDEDEVRQQEMEEEERITAQWGKKRSMYYDTDTRRKGDEVSDDEEEEAKRMRSERFEKIAEEDYGDDEMLFRIAQRPEKVAESKEQFSTLADRQLLAELNAELDAVDSGLDSSFSKIHKDFEGLSQEQKLELIESRNPELLPLIEDLSLTMEQIVSTDAGLISKLNLQKVSGTRGRLICEAFRHLVSLRTAYCNCIAFYLFLKSRTDVVEREHPVFGRILAFKKAIDGFSRHASLLYERCQEIANGHTDLALDPADSKGEELPVSEEEEEPEESHNHEMLREDDDSMDLEQSIDLEDSEDELDFDILKRSVPSSHRSAEKIANQVHVKDDVDEEAGLKYYTEMMKQKQLLKEEQKIKKKKEFDQSIKNM